MLQPIYETPDFDQIRWFAAKLLEPDTTFSKYLALEGITVYNTKFASRIFFIRCTLRYVYALNSEYWGRVYFYRDASRMFPDPIPDDDMNNFILVTSASDDLINLGEVTEEFIRGEKVRVLAGKFKGSVGVIKRVKGDRRLVVAIKGVTAVATSFIHPNLLEKVEE